MSEPIPCAVPRLTSARCEKPATHIVERKRGRRVGRGTETDPFEGRRIREPACDDCAAWWREQAPAYATTKTTRTDSGGGEVIVTRFSDIGGEAAVRLELCQGEDEEGCENGALIEEDRLCIDCLEQRRDRKKPSGGRYSLY